jgi:hypothetical protein
MSAVQRSPSDHAAHSIGGLFNKAKAACLESVPYLIECGARLKAKRTSLTHGEWLPWVEENKETLGFGERTAQLLIRATAANPQLTSDLTPTAALKISRMIWGNAPKPPPPRLVSRPVFDPPAAPVSEEESEALPVVTERYEFDEEDDRILEMAERDRQAALDEALSSDAQAVIAKLTSMNAGLTARRDDFMNIANNRNARLEAEMEKNRRLQDYVTRLEGKIQALEADNEALRERIAIMETEAA